MFDKVDFNSLKYDILIYKKKSQDFLTKRLFKINWYVSSWMLSYLSIINIPHKVTIVITYVFYSVILMHGPLDF